MKANSTRNFLPLILLIAVVLFTYNGSAQSISYSSSFDLSSGATVGDSYSFVPEAGYITDLTFNNDGTKLFALSSFDDEVFQYTLLTPYDITSTSYDDVSFDVSGVATDGEGIAFSSDGMKMFIIGRTSDAVHQYSLTTAFDLASGVTNDGSPFSITGQDLTPYDIAFNLTGTKMYFLGANGQDINQYTLTTPFNITSGVTFDGSFSYAGAAINARTFTFSNDGSKVFILGMFTDEVIQFSLFTAFDLTSTVTADEASVNIGPQNGSPTTLLFDDTGINMFMLGNTRIMFQYELNPGLFKESIDNDGSINNSAQINLFGETFTSPGGSFSHGSQYSITGLPTGLAPNLAISGDGSSATLTFTANANDHQDTDDVSNLVFTFQNSAFAGGNATAVTNAVTASSGIGVDFRNNSAVVSYGGPFDPEQIEHVSTYSMTTEDTDPRGIAFSNDGMKMFVIGRDNNSIYQYSLTNAFDISSGVTYDGSPFSVASENTQPEGIVFNPLGTKMYVPGSSGSEINQYSLTTPFDITSGVTFDGSPLSVISHESRIEGMTFSPDGFKLYIVGSNHDEINQFSLTTAFDITSGATVDGNPLSLASVQGQSSGLAFNLDGSKVYITGGFSAGARFNELDLNIPFDITSGGSSSGSSYTLQPEETAPRDLVLDAKRGQLFVIGSENGEIHQYDLGIDGFIESSANDGTIDNSIPIYISDEQFSNAGSTLTLTTDYTVTGVPAGLTPQLTVAADGYSANLSFTGSAANHQFANSTDNLTISFENSAFVASTASNVTNAINANTNFGISYFDNNPVIIYGTNYDITGGVTNTGNSFNVNSQETNPWDFDFSPDGMKMYLIGAAGDAVFQYSLTNPYDISSGVTLDGSHSTSAQENNASGLVFSTDGTKLFLVGYITRRVYQYTLTTPFDVTSGVSYDGDPLSVNTETSGPYGITFSRNGSRLYVLDATSNDVNQYSLSAPFDITSSVSFDGNPFSIAGQETNARDLLFSPDGKKMYMTGGTSDNVHQYTLTTAWDITSGVSLAGSTGSLAGTDTAPVGITFNPEGNKLYVLGATGDNVYEFDVNGTGISFTEASANDGSLDGVFNLTIAEERFTNAGATLTLGDDYTITGLPGGISPVVSIAADGLSASLSLTGNTSPHEDINDASGLTISFENSAFEGNDASFVFGSSATLDVDFDFDDNKALSYGNTFSLARGATFRGSYYIGSRESNPYGVRISANGTKMYVIGQTSDRIHQYTLAHPYDISNEVTYNGFYSVAAQETDPRDVIFNEDGTKVFVIGWIGDDIYQYSLSNPFDVTSGTRIYEGSAPVIGNPSGVVFSSNGKKLYVVNEAIVGQYTLNTPFDIAAGINLDGTFSITAENSGGHGISINEDGTTLFITGWNSDAVHQYSTTTPFDFDANITYDGISFDLSPQGGFPVGLSFGGDGKNFYTVDIGSDRVYRYELTPDRFVEGAGNDGSIDGSASIHISSETFANAGGTLAHGSDFTITNLPTGLVPVLTISSNGHDGTLTFTGNASNHQDVDDLAEISISYGNSAFSAGTTANIENLAGSTGVGINFRDNNPMVSYGNAFDVSFAPDDPSFSVDISATTDDPQDLNFSADGSKFYVIRSSDATIHQYSLSTPFSVKEGVTYDGSPFDVSSEETDPMGIAFSNNGTKMYVTGEHDFIYQYSLTTPFDITSGVSLDFGSLGVGVQEGFPTDLTFSNDGSKLFLLGTWGNEINQYSLTVPFDITSGASFDGHPFSVLDQEENPRSIFFSPSGTRLMIIGSLSDRVNQYTLTTPFDITSGVSFEANHPVGSVDFGPNGVAFSADGNSLFFVGSVTDAIHQYILDNDGFEETGLNDGEVSGSLTIHAMDESFTNPSGTLTSGADYSISNLPSGLTPTLTVAADGASAELTVTGNAAAHQDANDVDGLTFTFQNSAFVGGNASLVANSTATNSRVGVDFRDNNPALTYGDGHNLAAASYSGNSLDISSRDSYINGVAFNDDGTKLFTSGDNNDEIFEYNLSEPYSLSGTVTSTGNTLDISVNASSARDIYFSQDGTKLFILSTNNYEVVQYNLSTGFNLSTALYSGNSLSIEAQDDSPYALTFSPDGSRMYVAGSDSYAVNEYSLSTNFDVSTASFLFAFSVENDESSPSGIAFSPNGKYLIVVGDDNSKAIRYTLNVPFDLSMGASLDSDFVNLSTEDQYPTGLTISPDGSRLLISGSDNNFIYQYNIELGGFTEAGANVGTVVGSATLYMTDDTFTNKGGTLTLGSDYGINNLPVGFTPTLNVAADGYSASLTLTGSSGSHGDADDIASLQFIFMNSAFSNHNANEVGNAINHSSVLGIDFLPYTGNDISSFTFPEIDGSATIDAGNHTVVAAAAAGTDLSAITPAITVSTRASITPNSGVEQDFSTTVNYTVTAEDGTPQAWAVTITEALATPTDVTLSDMTIDENESSGTTVGALSSTDASFSDSHDYMLVAGAGDNDNSSFSIVGNELRSAETFDLETKSNYFIRVQTDDMNGGLFEKAFTISINNVNEVPTNITLSNNSIDESNPVGTLIGTLTTDDIDVGDTHTYTVTDGCGSCRAAESSNFEIVGNELRSKVVFDFETLNGYGIDITSTDADGLSRTEGYVITINDIPASVTSIDLSNNTVDENASSGTLVGTLTTTGEDLSGSYTYDFTSGTGDTDNALFDISGDQLTTTASFDFETKDSYSIRVMSDDGAGNIGAFQLTIAVNDLSEAPTDLSLNTTSIAENNTINDVIGSFSTTDEDAGETYTYTLISGIGDTDNASFDTDGDDLRAIEIFDFETQSSYSIRVQTSDGNGGLFEKTFTITVTNENESILVSNPINDLNLDEGFGSQNIDLSDVFTDQDGDALTYEVSSANTAVVTVSHTGTTLTLTEAGIGSAIVTVTADDGSGVKTSDNFLVSVAEVFSTETDIVAFSLAEQTGEATINTTDHTIALEVARGTDVTNLNPTVTVSTGASYVPGGSQNFANGTIIYTVTAEDGITIQEWAVTVTEAPSTETDMLSFALTEQTGEATIDAVNHTITIEVANGTDVTGLSPTISISVGASVSPEGAQDFTNPVTYTVTAEDGSTVQDWIVTVTVEPAEVTAIDDSQYDISAYPNPASEWLTIVSPFPSISSIQLFDLRGDLLMAQQMDGQTRISLQDLKNGLYLLKLTNDEITTTTKILIHR